MTRFLLVAVLVLGIGPALAAASDDFQGAEKAFEAGKHELAIDLYSSAIRSTELNRADLIAAYFHRGQAQAALAKYGDAKRDLDRALKMDPKNADLHVARGRIDIAQRSYDSATYRFEKAIAARKDDAEAYRYRCWAYAMLGKLRAMKDCREALRLNPDDPGALDSRALVYWLMGDEEAAKADLERARALDPAAKPWQERFKEFERKPEPL